VVPRIRFILTTHKLKNASIWRFFYVGIVVMVSKGNFKSITYTWNKGIISVNLEISVITNSQEEGRRIL